MSKLSEPLKALINAGWARPDMTAAPKGIRSLYERIARDANSKDVGVPCWLTIATAATMTMNSPGSLTELFHVTASSSDLKQAIQTAELMREVGLKCISFNGIPRTINCLGAFRAGLPKDVVQGLSRSETRVPNASNIEQIRKRGEGLWASIYRPFDDKLVNKLSDYHPDLPVHILNSHYGALLSDPLDSESRPRAGRVLTPLIAISCLRAQTGVGPQVISHIFGLRKAFEEDSIASNEEANIQGGRWLASDDGNIWILNQVDKILKEFGVDGGTTFAPGLRSKL